MVCVWNVYSISETFKLVFLSDLVSPIELRKHVQRFASFEICVRQPGLPAALITSQEECAGGGGGGGLKNDATPNPQWVSKIYKI
jgi:hypothetical protein